MTPVRPPVVVIGAGLAGLVAARALRRRGVPVVVFEASKRVAGLARSFTSPDGFTFDFGAHFITNRLAAALGIGPRCRDVHRYGESVWVRNRTYGYPFGLLGSPRFVASACLARFRSRLAPATAEAWYRAHYGDRLAEDVAIPLVEAWSGASAANLAASVIPPQVDRGVFPVLALKLASRLSGRAVANGYSREKPESPHVWHVYPEGGVGVVCEHLAAELGPAVQPESPVEAIYVDGGRAVGVRAAGRDYDASAVLSTAPVHVLPALVRGSEALKHLAAFRFRPMTLVNLQLEGRGVMPDVVTWIPDRQVPFFRVTEAPVSMPWLAPPGKTMLTVDFGCEVGDSIWTAPEHRLTELCLQHLQPIIPDVGRRYLGCRVLRTPVAHPVFLTAYEPRRLELERGLAISGLLTIGRNGEFAHILMEDVYWRTLGAVHRLLESGIVSPPSNSRPLRSEPTAVHVSSAP